MSINLDKASREEMKQYGMDELGISLSMTMREDTMRQKVRDAMTSLGIEESRPEPVNLAHTTKGEDWVVINIVRAEGKNGAEPVFVGYNGKGFTIPRGIDVAVPPAIEGILRNAIKTVYEQDADTGGELIGRDVQSYPYSVISGHKNLVGLKEAA